MTDRILRIIADTTGAAELPDAEACSVDNIPEWDSMAQLNIVLSLESTFNVSFSADEVLSLRSVAEIRNALFRHGVNDQENGGT